MRYTRRIRWNETHRPGQDYRLIDPKFSIEAKNRLGHIEDLCEAHGIEFSSLDRILFDYTNGQIDTFRGTPITVVHKSLIVSSKDYKEYVEEWKRDYVRKLNDERMFSETEYDYLKKEFNK